MSFQLLINGTDRTSVVQAGSLQKDDNINERVDSLKFSIWKHAGQTFKPQVNQEVELFDGVTKIFGGVIITVDEVLEGDTIIICDVECKDYSQFLDRRLVLERYTNATVEEIIQAIIIKYAPDFSVLNVNAPISVTSITFNRIPVSECLTKLAQIIGYYWYVDYNKDIHFFEQNDEPAPFDIEDDNDNLISGSLNINNDLSQIRNRVTIRGGEEEGNPRTELFDGDGTKLFFRLANKFARRPVVEVGGVEQVVGIDFLDAEADFDCFWSFQEKYIRFKPSTVPPTGTDNVDVFGTPLFPILVQRSDSASIAQFGVYEYFEYNAALKSRDEALEYALQKLTAYKAAIIEGSLQTYTAGLRSGQLLTINSGIFGINEDFIIQKVTTKLQTNDRPVYTVQLATLRTLGIIQILQGLLQRGGYEELADEVLFSFNTLEDSIAVTDEIVSITTVTGPYEWDSDSGGVANPALVWNFGTWAP